MLCLSGFELFSRWVPLEMYKKLRQTGLVVALLPAVLTLKLSLFHFLFTVAVAKAPY